MNLTLRELEGAVRHQLQSPVSKFLLVTKGTAPAITHRRLKVASALPDDDEPLRFDLIIFVRPFNGKEADALEYWMTRSNRISRVIRTTEGVQEVAQAVVRLLTAQPATNGAEQQERLTDRSTLEEMMRNRGGFKPPPVQTPAPVQKPAPAPQPAPPPPPPPPAPPAAPEAPVKPPKVKPVREKRTFWGSIQLSIARHISKGWSNVDAEVERITTLINAERPPDKQTNKNSVRHVFMMLLRRGLIPWPQRTIPPEARHEWVHQRVNYERSSDLAEAQRLVAVARIEGRTDVTVEDMLASIKYLVMEGDIKPVDPPDEKENQSGE